MAERNERVVLNELIVTCRDAARGFQWAADHARDPELQALFRKIAADRHQYVMDLLPHAQRLGGAPEGDGSRAATLHRAWMAVKDRLAPDHDHAILVEAERGERAALATYDDAINGMLPPGTRDVIETQQAGVHTAYERLQALSASSPGRTAIPEPNERVVLHELIVTCRDAARGFEWAADHARAPELQELFRKIASKRHEYVMELLPHAVWLGGIAPEGDGSRIAALHRAWMAVKDHLAADHDHAILVEAERGERAALATCAVALNGGLSPEARRVVEAQKAGVQTAFESLQALTTA